VSSPAGSAEGAGWDLRLREWPAANLLQSYGWGEVQGRAGWQIHRLEVAGPTGTLPVSVQVAPVGLAGRSRIYVPRGPVCAATDLALFEQLEQVLVAFGREHRALAIELEVPWLAGTVPAGHPWLGWAPCRPRQPMATVVVDLRPEPDAILASFRDKTRYNVRLAERRGVVVDEDASLQSLAACIGATESRQRIHLPSPGHLAQVRDQLGEAGHILAAEVDGEVVAAILTANFAGLSIYLYGGATGRYRERMPNQLLQWRAMLQARAEGCHHYDLWGVPENDDPRHPWRGLAQFKLGFGGEQIRYAGARFRQLQVVGGTFLQVTDAARRFLRTRGRR